MESELWALLNSTSRAPSPALQAVLPVLEHYGLSLSGQQLLSLQRREDDALRDNGRIELGDGALPRLLYAFCDSPYLDNHHLEETFAVLLDTFYACKNDAEELLSDEELIQAMAECFNGPAQGSPEFMAEITLDELLRSRKGFGRDE